LTPILLYGEGTKEKAKLDINVSEDREHLPEIDFLALEPRMPSAPLVDYVKNKAQGFKRFYFENENLDLECPMIDGKEEGV